MATTQARLNLKIDVLGEKNQRTLVQAGLTPTDLIKAIIDEFRELEYLSDDTSAYELCRAKDRQPLKTNIQLGKQIDNQEHLVLVEDEPPIPAGATAATQHVYLHEEGTRTVHKITWFPAVIGRPDTTNPQGNLLAVDLSGHERGISVSRRHAQITVEQGRFYVESLSQNPTFLRTPDGATQQIDNRRTALQPGDTLVLEQSHIALKLVVRSADRPAS